MNSASERAYEIARKQVRNTGLTIAHEADKIVNDYDFQCAPLEINIIIDPDKGINGVSIEIKNTIFPYITEEYLKEQGEA